ncbi:MAG: DUF192 domain-containing protein [Candidatus Eremiobacteraeota bacterium]|nr:DUF192 domain-containing protein [Candidatus Eremiobacteraeota bacterium]
MQTLRNATTGAILATRVTRATSMLARGIGLLGRGSLDADEGLWIERCGAVHTMGMRATLDLIFVDRDDRVVRIERGVRPNRFAVTCRGAAAVIELGAGEPRAVAPGDRVVLDRAGVS